MMGLTVCLGHRLPTEAGPSGNTDRGMLSRKGADYKCRYLSRLRSRLLSGNGQHTPGRPGITFGRTHITLKGAKKNQDIIRRWSIQVFLVDGKSAVPKTL